MKFHFTPEIIIGTLLIIWGASIIIKILTGIDIPIFKPLLAIFLIYLGLSMLFGSNTNYWYKRDVFTYTVKDERSRDNN